MKSNIYIDLPLRLRKSLNHRNSCHAAGRKEGELSNDAPFGCAGLDRV